MYHQYVPALDGVNPALEVKVPLAVTVEVPTVVPPLVQLVGAVACGPNTV